MARTLTMLCLAICAPLSLASAQTAGTPGTWKSKAPVPLARNEVVAVAAGGKIYVLGGNNAGDKYDLATNEEYDPATDQWRTRAPMPKGANHLGATELNGRIYAVGGFDGRGHGAGMDYFLNTIPQQMHGNRWTHCR